MILPSPKKSVKTPEIKKAKTLILKDIQARRKSYGAPADVIPTESVIEDAQKAVVSQEEPVKVSLKTPIKDAINARRKSYSAATFSSSAKKLCKNQQVLKYH